MLLKVIIIFCLFLAIGLCETNAETDDVQFLRAIREDYCLDYCANECKLPTADNKDVKTCRQDESAVVTDKYVVKITVVDIELTWKIAPGNIKYLKKLNSSDQKWKVFGLRIEYYLEHGEIIEEPRIQSIDYMKALNLYELKDFTEKTPSILIYESKINVNKGPASVDFFAEKGDNITPSILNYLSRRMENLKTVLFYNTIKFELPGKIFENNTQLESIGIMGFNLNNFNAETFENLKNLSSFKFADCELDFNNLLRLTHLQNNLKEIAFKTKEKIDLTLLEKYQKLETILLGHEDISNYAQEFRKINSPAFLCNTDDRNCQFNIGLNGKLCPTNCECLKKHMADPLVINCTSRGLLNISEMPIPIVGSSVYHFENNSLTQLPNFSSEGLDNVLQLHLANNKLTNLSVEQLPQNLTWLDIRNNSLNSIDSKVVEFLKNREINILQTGIKWRPSCENKELISYLSNLKKYVKIEFWHDSIDNPVFYERLNGPCPSDCTCCFEDNQLLVNCTGTGYYTVPKLSNLIIGDSSLLLEDNRILSLSTTGFLRNSTIKELNVKNNYINEIHLDELPVNLTLLDIRENHLKALDDDVTDFISHLPQIRLSDNPWQCNCKYTKFLNYLRKTNPIEYKAALKNCNVQEDCPDHCTCCKNDSDRKTSIKCN